MPDERFIGLFCWADLSAKTGLDWQEEVIRSHQNIPQHVIVIQLRERR
jgi:hypothetical protein